jgi:hypothetical protein
LLGFLYSAQKEIGLPWAVWGHANMINWFSKQNFKCLIFP